MAPEYDRSPIQKFNVPGQVASGPFGGIRKGKFESNLVQIGNVTYGSSKVLDEKLKDVALGTYLVVMYKGLVPSKRPDGKPYKDYTFQFGNETKAESITHVVRTINPPIAEPAAEEQNLQFLLLLSRLQIRKGDHITGIIKSACELSNDPYEALVSAVKQMGLADLLEDEVPF